MLLVVAACVRISALRLHNVVADRIGALAVRPVILVLDDNRLEVLLLHVALGASVDYLSFSVLQLVVNMVRVHIGKSDLENNVRVRF